MSDGIINRHYAPGRLVALEPPKMVAELRFGAGEDPKVELPLSPDEVRVADLESFRRPKGSE